MGVQDCGNTSCQGHTQDFSKGMHNFPNLSPSPTTMFSRFIHSDCHWAFPLIFCKYIGPRMNHASLYWKPTFRCKKERVHCFRKNISAKQAELKFNEFRKLERFSDSSLLILYYYIIFTLKSFSGMFVHTVHTGSCAPGCIPTYIHFSVTMGVWDCRSTLFTHF